MSLKAFDWKTLIAIGVLAGLIQAAAGVAMYVAGIYFTPWSMFVTGLVLLLCVVFGIKWYRDSALKGRITFGQALVVGVVISVCTGIVYAIYNLISISFIYSGFLETMVNLNLASAPASERTPEFVATLRERITANMIALANLIRLSVFGTILSVFASLILKRTKDLYTERTTG